MIIQKLYVTKLYFMHMVWTNIIATNVSINFQTNKVRYKIDCYILHTVSLVIVLPLIIAIICYHYAKHENIGQN